MSCFRKVALFWRPCMFPEEHLFTLKSSLEHGAYFYEEFQTKLTLELISNIFPPHKFLVKKFFFSKVSEFHIFIPLDCFLISIFEFFDNLGKDELANVTAFFVFLLLLRLRENSGFVQRSVGAI